MKAYTIYIKGRKKGVKVLADKWIVDKEWYIFLSNDVEIFRVYEDELIAIKRRSL